MTDMQVTPSMWALLLLTAITACHASASFGSRRFRHTHKRSVDGFRAHGLANGCLEEQWHTRRLDHFSRSQGNEARTWQQRVYVCARWWRTSDATGTGGAGARGPIFFYAGNEGDVMLYVNNTGLMWEHAEAHGALLVFAEHRYYGQSQPFGPDSWAVDPTYLTTGQALADYAQLIWTIKHTNPGAEDSAVIVFGGSYGGELAVWMRLKYPHLVQGSIAASAPILGFPGIPGFNANDYWQVVTYSASAAAGAPAACVNMTRLAFRTLMGVKDNKEGRLAASRLLRLCRPMESPEDVTAAAYWLQGAFDAFAMGNYPYPSSYINDDPDHPLPAWPMRAACRHMTKTLHMYMSDLLDGLANAVGLMYNASGTLTCYDLTTSGPAAGDTGPWDFQVCTEQMAQEQPYFPANGVTDMFWDQGPYNPAAIAQHCMSAWKVQPEAQLPFAPIQYGGLDALSQTSNIVLSNGLMDPWSAFGVLMNVSGTVVAVIIPEGAHHVDLMFSQPDADTPSIQEARRVEMEHVGRWVRQHAASVARNRAAQGAALRGGAALTQTRQGEAS